MDKRKIKIIASDLDGTFLDTYKNIPEVNIEAVNELIDKGMIFIPTSGRDYPSMKDLLQNKVKEIPYYSCFNGARIFKNGKIINLITMDKNVCAEFIKKGMELGIKYCATSGYNVCYSQLDTEYYKEFNSKDTKYTFHSNENLKNLKAFDFEKMVFFGESNELKKMKEFVMANYPDEVNIFFSGRGLIDIVSKKCSKGKGLKIIADDLNISLDDVMAFGDNENDLAMLTSVGYPVAMKNGKPNVRETIQVKSEFTNDEGGVGLYLKEYFKEL